MTQRTEPEASELLTPAEVAFAFKVDPKTVTRWARAGRLTWIRTPGGHRRYYRAEIQKLLRAEQLPHTRIYPVRSR